MTDEVKFLNMNNPPAEIDPNQHTIEAANHPVAGVPLWAWRDAAGAIHYAVAMGEPAALKSLQVIDPTTGLFTVDVGVVTITGEGQVRIESSGGANDLLLYGGGNASLRAVTGSAIVEALAGPIVIDAAGLLDLDGAGVSIVDSTGAGVVVSSTGVGSVQIGAGGMGDLNLLSVGGEVSLLDQHVAAPVTLSETGVTELTTDSDSLVGAINEVLASTFPTQFDGTAIERQDTFVVVDSGVVYMDVELVGGGDLPVQLLDKVYSLDCTTGAGVGGRARVALTPGTDTEVEFNFVYVEIVGGVATLKSSVTAPASAYAFLAYVSLWSATKTATDLAASHQRSTDAKEHNGVGRIAHIDARLRQEGAVWAGGVTPTAQITTQGAALDDLQFTVTPGSVWQLHPQVFPAIDTAVGGIFVANASGLGTLTKYQKITNLNQCLETAAGTSLSGLRFNLTIWGAINKTSGECKLFVNLPASGYATDDSAYYDVDGSAITSAERALFSVAFLIARIPVRHRTLTSGTLSFINPVGLDEIIPLLGLPMGASASGGAGGGGGAATLNQLTDVEIATPVVGQHLEYDGALWKNEDNNANAVSVQGAVVSEDVPAYDAIKNWLLELIHYWNYILWSSDIAQLSWAKTSGVAISGTNGVITPAASGSHALTQNIVFTADIPLTFSARMKKGINDYVVMYLGSGGTVVGVNLDTGAFSGTFTSVNDSSIVADTDGWYRVKVNFTPTTTIAQNNNFYASVNGSTLSTTGDGINPAFYIEEVEFSNKISIADSFPHIPTTTVPVSAPAYVYEENTGGDSTKLTQLQRVDDETWETATTGVEYFSPDQLGGIHGKIIRKFFSGTTVSPGAAVALGLSPAKILNQAGYLESSVSSDRLLWGEELASTFFASTWVDDSAAETYLTSGTSFAAGSIYEGWIDHTLVTPPTTNPSAPWV